MADAGPSKKAFDAAESAGHHQVGVGGVGGVGLGLVPSAMDPLHSAVGFPPGMDRTCKYPHFLFSYYYKQMNRIMQICLLYLVSDLLICITGGIVE